MRISGPRMRIAGVAEVPFPESAAVWTMRSRWGPRPFNEVNPRSGEKFNSLAQQFRQFWIISGVTRDGAGSVLGGCVVKLFRSVDDVLLDSSTSDGTTGAFRFSVPSNGWPCYLVAYLAGSPDKTGATVNTVTVTLA
jgi:hypothetical protein